MLKKSPKRGRASAAAVVDVPNHPDADPRLESLRIRLLELRRQGNRDNVEIVVEMGELLLEAKPLLTGKFGEWLSGIGLSTASASNYINLAKLAAAYPQIVHQYKELGPSKLYMLMRLPEAKRLAILETFDEDTLFRMTDADYVAEVIEPNALPSTATITPAMKAHGFRMKVRTWKQQIKEFKTYIKKHKAAELPEDMRTELRQLQAELADLV